MAKSNNKNVTYSAKDITSLRPEEHLIKRMNLTFSNETGDESNPFSSQKSVACREIQDNGTSEISRGYGNYVRTRFFKDGSVEVQDNGRGLPTDTTINAFGEEVSGFIVTMGTLQSGENLGENEAQGKATNQNGLGGSAVNFLSSRMDIKVYKNNKVYNLSFKKGVPGFFEKDDDIHSKFEPIKDKTYIKVSKDNRPASEKEIFSKGTAIKFWLNDEVFASPYPINVDDMITRIKGTAFLLPGNTFEVINELRTLEDGSYQHEIYKFEEGISQLVELNQNGTPITPIQTFKTEGFYTQKNVPVQGKDKKIIHKDMERSVDIEFSFGYTNSFDYSSDSYVNTIRTKLGGVHVDAFEEALTKAFNERILSMKSIIKASDPTPTIDDYREGLSVVLSVYVSEPEFSNQIKEKLGGKVVKKAIYNAIYTELSQFAQASKNQSIMKTIAEKVAMAAKIRQAKRDEQELKREKAKLKSNSSNLPEKLVDCEVTHSEYSELFIAEGDSAVGSLKAARISKYQAILPIRGKIVNVKKETLKKVLANKEVQDIIKCLDAGVGDDFDIDNARYQRVFLACDADVDGGQIASLLVLFFYTLFPGLVTSGRLFKMNSPLFFVKEKKVKKMHYCFTQQEYDNLIKELEYYDEKTGQKKSRVERVIRAKGLGEVGAKELREASMYPETRNITQITLEDVKEAEEALNIAMGTDLSIRKKWIELNPMITIED